MPIPVKSSTEDGHSHYLTSNKQPLGNKYLEAIIKPKLNNQVYISQSANKVFVKESYEKKPMTS